MIFNYMGPANATSVTLLWCRWNLIEDGNVYYKDMDRLVAFQKGLTTWARWVESNIDFSKTRVFFQGISPAHSM